MSAALSFSGSDSAAFTFSASPAGVVSVCVYYSVYYSLYRCSFTTQFTCFTSTKVPLCRWREGAHIEFIGALLLLSLLALLVQKYLCAAGGRGRISSVP